MAGLWTVLVAKWLTKLTLVNLKSLVLLGFELLTLTFLYILAAETRFSSRDPPRDGPQDGTRAIEIRMKRIVRGTTAQVSDRDQDDDDHHPMRRRHPYRRQVHKMLISIRLP